MRQRVENACTNENVNIERDKRKLTKAKEDY